MPVRVHALLFVRAEDDSAAPHLRRTLAALSAQTRAVDAVTLIVAGRADSELDEIIAASGAEGVVGVPRLRSAASAYAIGAHRLGDADAVWLLAQDTAPEPDALRRLAGVLDLTDSAAMAAPKLIDWREPDRIISLGVSVTRFGRSIPLVSDELDQGQHDAREDALGADVRGLLVRRSAWDALGGIDPALVGADDGLDLGVRARLIGARTVLVPGAHVAVAGDGASGLPRPVDAARRRQRTYGRRVDQLHRRLVYAAPALVFLLWLVLPVLAVGRTVLHLVRKDPAAVLAEWAATLVVWVRVAALAQARRRLRRATRSAGGRPRWSRVQPLRVTRADLHRRFDGGERADTPIVRADLRFFTGGGAWTVLAALAVGLAVFLPLLAWPALGGGALLPLHDSVGALWADTLYGRLTVGLDSVGPADPFALVVAVLGTLTPWNPSQAVVLLWVLAFPLAALGGWFAATRLTERSGYRIAGAALWCVAPTFLVALMTGRPSAVLVHLLLPWLFYTGAVAGRSWSSAAAASLMAAAVLACAPVLVLPLAVVWLVAIVGIGRGAVRIAWLPVPALVLFAPLVWSRGLGEGDWWGLLADPGVPSGAASVGTADRLAVVSGFPTTDLAGWSALAPLGVWAWVLIVPLGVLALSGLLLARWRTTLALLGIAAAGLFGAFAALVLFVQSVDADVFALWPGAALSLAWLGVSGAAITAVDVAAPRPVRLLQPWLATVAVLGVAVVAVVPMSAPARDSAVIAKGTGSTLPAYITAVGRGRTDTATLVLRPLADGSIAARVIWGAGQTLGGQNTALSTRERPDAQDERTAELVAGLITPGQGADAADLAALGIRFVLRESVGEEAAANALALQTDAALDARGGLEVVGETGRGNLWRLAEDPTPRAAADASVGRIAGAIAVVQVVVLLVVVLIAFPTAASRRQARAYPRVVGLVRGRRRSSRRRRRPAENVSGDGLGGAPDAKGVSAGEGADEAPAEHGRQEDAE